MEKIITIKIETEEDEERILDYFRYKLLDDFPKERIKLIEVEGKEKLRFPKIN